MPDLITILRSDAVRGIRSAISAAYRQRTAGGALHRSPASVGAVVQAFLGGPPRGPRPRGNT